MLTNSKEQFVFWYFLLSSNCMGYPLSQLTTDLIPFHSQNALISQIFREIIANYTVVQ